MTRLLMSLFVILAAGIPAGFAEEAAVEAPASQPEIQSDAGDMPVYQFPVIKPEYNIYGGYNSMHLKGSRQAEEYRVITDSLVFGGEMRMITYPHRLHLDADIFSVKDYDADVSYAYRDLALFRFRNNTFFHNLDNVRLLFGSVNALDAPGRHYGIKSSMNDFLVRLKAPDFPAHLYVSGSYIEKKGTRQDMALLGSGSFNNRIRTSQARSLDWTTKEITVGANSLLGPVEVDVSHTEKRFDPGSHNVLFDSYASAGAIRNEGLFPRSMNPETKTSANTLRLHTLYSGGLSASATITKIDRNNTDGGAKSDYFIGSGQVMWSPMTKLTFFIKYRHKEVDFDNPRSIGSIEGIAVCSPANNAAGIYRCQIRPSVSSMTDTITGIGRYRPFAGVALKGEVTYEDVRRDEYREWRIPRETERTAASLSADVRIARNVKVMAKYTHRDSNNPATNVEPENADEGKVALSWMPFLELNTSLGYDIAKGKSDDIYIFAALANKRETKRQRVIAQVSYLLLKDLSVGLSYAYMDNKVRQDLVYSDTAGGAFADTSVPGKDVARTYMVDASYMPKGKFLLNAGISHTNSRGSFSPSNILGQAVIGDFSRVETNETVLSLAGKYPITKTVEMGLQYRYVYFEDVLDRPYDDVDDGRVHAILLTMRKEW